MTCHSCHYKRDDVINCEFAMTNGGRHAFCANCLRRRCNVDFHALRTGLVAWKCPVCHDVCPCAACKRKRKPGTELQKYKFEYSNAVDTTLVSVRSGGQAEHPAILDFAGAADNGGPTVIRLTSPSGATKGRVRMHHATVLKIQQTGNKTAGARPSTRVAPDRTSSAPQPAAGQADAQSSRPQRQHDPMANNGFPHHFHQQPVGHTSPSHQMAGALPGTQVSGYTHQSSNGPAAYGAGFSGQVPSQAQQFNQAGMYGHYPHGLSQVPKPQHMQQVTGNQPAVGQLLGNPNMQLAGGAGNMPPFRPHPNSGQWVVSQPYLQPPSAQASWHHGQLAAPPTPHGSSYQSGFAPMASTPMVVGGSSTGPSFNHSGGLEQRSEASTGQGHGYTKFLARSSQGAAASPYGRMDMQMDHYTPPVQPMSMPHAAVSGFPGPLHPNPSPQHSVPAQQQGQFMQPGWGSVQSSTQLSPHGAAYSKQQGAAGLPFAAMATAGVPAQYAVGQQATVQLGGPARQHTMEAFSAGRPGDLYLHGQRTGTANSSNPSLGMHAGLSSGSGSAEPSPQLFGGTSQAGHGFLVQAPQNPGMHRGSGF